MSKKLITACLAVVALAAFALPATASASPRLCETTADHKTCHDLLPGVKIKATSVGLPEMVAPGGSTLTTCSTAWMTGTLVKNNGTEIEGTIETTTFAGTGAIREGEAECTGSFGNISVDTNLGNGTPWCLKASGAEHKFTLRGNSCNLASRPITFVLTSTTIGTCKYSRAAALTGTFNTDLAGTEDAILTATPGILTEFTREEGSFLCPAAGQMKMSFTLETDTTPLLTKDPIYIK